MSGNDSNAGRRWGRIARFLRDDAGAATAEWVVMTGLAAAIAALVMLDISSGTSSAATTIASDLERGADTVVASAGNHRARANEGPRASTHYRPSDHGAPDQAAGGGAPGGGAGGGESAGGGGGGAPAVAGSQQAASPGSAAQTPGPAPAADAGPGAAAPDAVAAAGAPVAAGASGSARQGSGTGDAGADPAAAESCGLGRGNASATANARANGRAHQTPAAACPGSPRA